MEHHEQCAVVEWFDLQYPSIRGRLFACANGGMRHKGVGKKLKKEGVRKGVPDLVLPYPTIQYHGLFIEMKNPVTGTVSDEQKDWIAYLNAVHYKAIVCYGFEEARKAITDYLM